MGKWVERDTSFLNFDVYNCTYCGKVIPRRIYYEVADEQERPFCGPECHRRHMQRGNKALTPAPEQPRF